MDGQIAEVFGRDVKFEDIENIKKVFHPGILSLPYFFNPESLKESLSWLCGYGTKDILVYFNEIENMDIISNKEEKKRNWWEAFQDFVPLVKHLPAGCGIEYWYEKNKKPFSSPEFKQDYPPYQAFVRLFRDAIQGFSCFVNQNPNQIEFSSWRCNYETIKPGEALIHDKKTLWQGKPEVFLKSAQIMKGAFYNMKGKGYKVGIETMAGARRREIRIIYPDRGALVGSLYGNDSLTFLLENSSLEKLAQQCLKRRERILSLV